MALSVHAKHMLAFMMGSREDAAALAVVIDADGGTLAAGVRERLIQAVGDQAAGVQIADAIDADTPIPARAKEFFRHAIGNDAAFLEIDTEIA